MRSTRDGSRLVYQGKDSAGKVQLYAVPTIGGNTIALTAFQGGVESDACFFPADDWLAVASEAAIYKVTLDAPNGHPRTELLFKGPLPGAPRNLCFSPDGTMLAMNIAVEGRQQIFLLKKTNDSP